METENNNALALVTGGSGFVALHAIQQLLDMGGYTVRTTIRSLNRKEEVLAALKNAGLTNFNKLTFVETDLSADQ